MLVVNRFRVPEEEGTTFAGDLAGVLTLFAQRPGHLGGTIGRSVDDPELWVLATTWENVGAYRRAIGSYDVRLSAWPTLARALEEPSAFEVIEPGAEPNQRAFRGSAGEAG